MSEPLPHPPWISTERKLSGTTRVLLAFVTGTLFALLPMYYFYTASDASRREAQSGQAAEAPAAAAVARPEPSAEESSRFAARMTYELSQTPEEPTPAPVKATAPLQVPPDQSSSAAAAPANPGGGPSDERPLSRVANARPINATPPDPRDTTREIEKEARRPEYRESPPRQTSKALAEPVQARVVEGRDLVLPPKPPIATRPIGATSASASRQGSEPDIARRGVDVAFAPSGAQDKRPIEIQTVISGGAAVAGVLPIGPPPEPSRAEPGMKAPAGVGAADPGRGMSGDVVESRLAATREWLTAAPQTTHTIQLMGTNSEEQLKAQLKALSKVLEPKKIYVFRTLALGKPAMTVVYGAYSDRQAALQALEKLPAAVSANRPVVRTVNGILTEMKQHGIRLDS
jgi:septal ring-binding cell division protein DamX